jgi:hypothetical protein
MPFNIENFRAHFYDKGYLQNNKFELYVERPNILRSSSIPSTYLIKYRASGVLVPSLNLIPAEVFRYGIGTRSKYVHNAQVTDFVVNIIVDKNADLWDFWYTWLNSIFQYSPTETPNYRHPAYTLNYKDDYSALLQLIVYDNYGEIAKKINFYEAFPLSIREIPLDWKSQNELMELSITMAYKELTLTD